MSKVGRNAPCPCGSGKKFKHCCIDAVDQTASDFADSVEVGLMQASGLDEAGVNQLVGQEMQQQNQQGLADFCGLSPDRISDWMYSPLDQIQGLRLTTPKDMSGSPVMRYLALIVEAVMAQKNGLGLTAKGNLPTWLVKEAAGLYEELAVARDGWAPSDTEFGGRNEDAFNALHYTRVLAELASLIEVRGKKLHLTQKAHSTYQTHGGIDAFFWPMLETAIFNYNWAYLDRFPELHDLPLFWVFMLWRLQAHQSVSQLQEEMQTAFPPLYDQLPEDKVLPKAMLFGMILESRFVRRFLEFWGFASIDPRYFDQEVPVPRTVTILPLWHQTFAFEV